MQQFHYIVGLLLSGVIMGVVYDVYNTVTSSSKWLFWLRAILDILFWVASAIFVFLVTFVTDDGRFRLYTFGLLLIGYLLYRVTLHRLVVGSAFAFVRFVRGTILLIWGIIHVLVIRPIRLVIRICLAVCKACYRILLTLENGLFAILHFWLRILFWPIPSKWKNQRKYLRFSQGWEEMWTRAANILKKKSERV